MNNEIKCPKCGSTQLTTDKKGFSGKQAIGGAILTGGIGVLAGTIGSNKVIITCLACGNQFKPGENLEGKKRKAEELRKQQEEQMKLIKKPMFWVVLLIISGFIIYVFSPSSPNQSSNTNTNTSTISVPEPEKINYKVIEDWNVGKLILIDVKQTNVETLKKLGLRLNYEMKDFSDVQIIVFNNIKAAGMYHKLESLSKSDETFYDKHFIAVYHKNTNTSFNRMVITINGLSGEQIDVNF
jgi:hypothetical protein